jgi:phosphoserine phosphatase RsbU/P
MPEETLHVLVVNNDCPLPGPLADVLADGKFSMTRVRSCAEVNPDTFPGRIDAAVVINTGDDSHRRADILTEAARLGERFSATRVGLLILIPPGYSDQVCESCDFLEPIAPDTPPDELRGRLRTMARYRPVIQQLERELTNMQRLGKKLNRHFTEIDQEMRLASRLQRDFLPQEMPTIGGIRFSSLFRPASWVSGDIYDAFRVDESHVGMYVADAVGHGMAAGLLTMFIKRAIVPKRIFGKDYELIAPGEVLGVLNENLKAQNLPNCQFVTACYCLYDVATRKLQVARGGHPYPIRIGTDGSLTEIRSTGGLLGVFPGEEFETVTTSLVPGERLLIYSDGIELAFLESRPHPEGDPRYRKEFQAVAQLPADQLITRLESLLDQEEGSLSPQDDVTVIVLEVPKGA